MATRTPVAAMQDADEAGLDPTTAYSLAADTANRPNAYPAGEQDGVEAELYGERKPDALGAFRGLMGKPANDPDAAAAPPPATNHGDNLAPLMDEDGRNKLARELLEEIDAAAESRAPWLDIMVKGIKALGYDRSIDKRNDPFPGASGVVHPSFAKAVVDMAARTLAQLAPPEGPAGTKIIGDETPEKREAADRIGDFINWQCTEQMPEWRPETDRTLTMVGPEGSSFKKTWYCPIEKRPRVAYIPAEQIIMPYSATCEMSSPLVGEEMWKLPHQVQALIDSGFWLQHKMGEPSERPASIVREKMEEIVGTTSAGSEDTQAYRGLQYYEAAVTRAIPGLEGGAVREYLVTVSREHQQLVAVRRNWRMNDKLMRRRRTLQHYKLFSWSGAYGLGLWHMIGGLSTSATGALRALLDSAHWVNKPGGFRLKTARQSGGTVTVGPGEFAEIEAPAGVTDIRQVLMADPHPGPSPVLFELLGMVGNEAREFAGIMLQDTDRDTANTPVGTTLARVDEGSRVYSSIFVRLHGTQSLELKAIHQIDAETLAEQQAFHGDEMPEIMPEDFGPGVRVVPASDPRTYSQLQQTMKAQARIDLAERAKAQGEQVNAREAYRDAFKAMQLGDPDGIFPPDPDPFSGDPFTENSTLITGGKLEVKPEQPHEEHLMVHLPVMLLPGMAVTPAGQNLMQHIIKHAGMGALAMAMAGKMAKEKMLPTEGMPDPGQWYASIMQQLAPALLPPGDPSVDKLVKVEEAKVEATREKIHVETEAELTIEAERTANKRAEKALEHKQTMAKIAAEDGRAEAKATVDVALGREKIASEERKKAADIISKAATPPPPKPDLPPGKKSGAK